ncbi:MAG TPA: cytochrome c3 family protein [Gemmatimonadales bacterium]|nr:cytochrome c3 family protein [Gemmatimonadales bacterium]
MIHVRTRPIAVLLVAAALALPTSAWSQAPEQPTCITCHEILPDARLSNPAKNFRGDVHATKGFGCVACHGGDATIAGLAAMDPDKGYLGKPARELVPQLCGRCHSDAQYMRQYNPALRVDQETEYATSVHGQRLARLNDPNVATCVSCHPAHDIRPPSDPQSSVHPLQVGQTCGACHANPAYMASYGIPTDQEEKYERSIHWTMLSEQHDLSAPTCNDCHGNHGAAPPGVSWVGNTCGQCHSTMADYFAQSLHAKLFPMLGVPGCAACHNNHEIVPASDELLGFGEGAACVRCHKPESASGEKIQAMRSLLDSLILSSHRADSLLLRAENSGVEVSQALFDLEGAQTALVQARAAVHAFVVDSVAAHVNAGLVITDTASARGDRAMGELRFRRTGLAVSVGIILLLIAGLMLRIREIDRKAVTT